jgi:hypothetical protein
MRKELIIKNGMFPNGEKERREKKSQSNNEKKKKL